MLFNVGLDDDHPAGLYTFKTLTDSASRLVSYRN